jgi:C-terminal processing protease CtpA/Prc
MGVTSSSAGDERADLGFREKIASKHIEQMNQNLTISNGSVVAKTKTTVGLGMNGKVIDAIVPYGPASFVGTLQVGDTLMEIDGTPVNDLNIGALLVGADRAGVLVRLKTRR